VASPNQAFYLQRIKSGLSESIAVKQKLLDDERAMTVLVAMATEITRAIKQGGKLLICGNGGSAADSQHLAAELVVRLRPNVDRGGLPALSLALDAPTLTACGNDYGYDRIFARCLEALGRSGDVLLGITTSGKSPNILAALDKAADMGVVRFGFLGGDGGPALDRCERAFSPPSNVVARVQECHITAGHLLMEMIEDMCLADGATEKA